MDSQSSQSKTPVPVEETVYFLSLKFRQEVNAQVRRLLAASGIDVEELENDLENGRNSGTVQRAKELLASVFEGDPYEFSLRVIDRGDVEVRAEHRHLTPIDPLTLSVAKTCVRCGVEGPFGDSLCPSM